MPFYDSPTPLSRYYVIERTGVLYHERYLKTLGKIFLIGEDPDQSKHPTWGYLEHAFQFASYTAACHWLARWRPAGTYRLVHVNDDEGTRTYCMDGPVEPDCFDERDWKEFHHMNGRSN